MEPVKIALWSGPRNISTAMMYSFGNRADSTIVDEPLFGYFLNHTGVWRPSRDEVLASMETDALEIVKELCNPSMSSKVYFMKHIANHLIDLDWTFLKNFKNIILTRDPKRVLLSYDVHVKSPTMLDVAYKAQYELLNYLKNNKLQYIVLDADEVLENPEKAIENLCLYLSIPFDTNMLEWEPGPRKEDGVWAKYWYHNVHKSTGFKRVNNKELKLPEHLEELYNECLIYYNNILKK